MTKTIYYLVNGEIVGSSDENTPLNHTFQSDGVYEVTAIYKGTNNEGYGISNTKTIHVKEGTVTQSGKYKLTISSPSTFHYRDRKEYKLRLTKGGQPVKGETIEVTNFKRVTSMVTDKNGYVTIKNSNIHTTPDEYVLGGRFYVNGKQVAKVFKKVKVVKANSEFWKITNPSKNNNYVIEWVLRNKESNPYFIAGKKVIIKVNNTIYNKKTASDGTVRIGLKKKGDYTISLSYSGNNNYKGTSKTYHISLR